MWAFEFSAIFQLNGDKALLILSCYVAVTSLRVVIEAKAVVKFPFGLKYPFRERLELAWYHKGFKLNDKIPKLTPLFRHAHELCC
ncbi:MAG: hypothetical protein ACK4HM_11175, partial [Thermosynechococcus sp.]